MKELFNFSAKDVAFLEEMSVRFPHIKEGFRKASQIAPEERPNWAYVRLGTMKRRGFENIGIPEEKIQTILDHIVKMIQLARRLNTDDQDLEKISRIIWVHDAPEAIVDDFTPDDDIEKHEKSRLEHLAAQALFGGKTGPDFNNWVEYETKKTKAARWTNDIDKLEVLDMAFFYRAFYPSTASHFDMFWGNQKDRLLTKRGKELFRSLETQWKEQPPDIPHCHL